MRCFKKALRHISLIGQKLILLKGGETVNGDVATIITSITWLLIGVMVAAVLWKISQLVDALKENIKDTKKS